MKKITAVIIAAGAAARMRTVKQLLPFSNSTLLGKVITQAQRAAVDEVVTVLGANYEKIREEISSYITGIVENENWEQGMGSSIAAGMQYLVESDDPPNAVLILLGDQPLIDADYLDSLLKRYREDPDRIVATLYPKSKGVPAIFPSAYFSELVALEGDSGAKDLLNSGENKVIALDAGDKTFDVDTPQDYRQLRDRFE